MPTTITAGHYDLIAGTYYMNIWPGVGGVKLSGLGRENGRAALEHYTQIKSVYVALRDIDSPY